MPLILSSCNTFRKKMCNSENAFGQVGPFCDTTVVVMRISRSGVDDGNIYYDMKGCAMCRGF